MNAEGTNSGRDHIEIEEDRDIVKSREKHKDIVSRGRHIGSHILYHIHNERAEVICYNDRISRFIVWILHEKLQ